MKTDSDQDALDIDQLIAEKIRMCRRAHEMSQTKLAGKVGVAWQQIQKYESGKNRVSASMLWKIASVFGLPINYFFEGVADALEDNKDIEMSLSQLRVGKMIEMFSWMKEEEREIVCSFLMPEGELDKVREIAE
jgi:transcriptional regulator with XRE-family HTH domain